MNSGKSANKQLNTQPNPDTGELPVADPAPSLEAAASDNFYVISPDGFHHQITVRSNAKEEDLYNLFAMIGVAESYFVNAGWKPKKVGKEQDERPPAPSVSPSDFLPPQPPVNLPPAGEPEYIPDQYTTGTPPAPLPQVPGLENGIKVSQVRHVTPPEQMPGAIGKFQCVYVEINPKQQGKVEVAFFGNDRRQPHNEFATVRFVGAPTKAAELLAKTGIWSPDRFASPASFNVNWYVTWAFSPNRTSQGNLYKNIQEVLPIIP